MHKKYHHSDNIEVVISIRNLTKAFDDNHVLHGVDLKLHKGENVVVLGRSGAGKSVLIKIIAGLIKQDNGSVIVLGKEISSISKSELQQIRLKLGFSFQGSALYDSMTVRENLEFPLIHHHGNLTLKQRTMAVHEVLEAVGLLRAINQMPSDLSGGQRKRIGIARTLIMKPEIMLYDEPTSGLDPITSEEINELINEVQERYNTSSIIITHDLTCAKTTGDRLAMLIEGKFLRKGSFDEIFNTNDERVKPFYDYNFIQ